VPVEAKPLFRPDVLRPHLTSFQLPGDSVRVMKIIDATWIEIIDGMFSNRRGLRVPVASSPGLADTWHNFVGEDIRRAVATRWPSTSSPALNPRSVAAKAMAKIDRGLMQGLLRGSRPKLKLVAVAAATMTEVAADRHVHRERATATTAQRPRLVQRTTSVPLRPRSIRGLEPKQAQDLLHRDLSANPVEVDARHGCSSLS